MQEENKAIGRMNMSNLPDTDAGGLVVTAVHARLEIAKKRSCNNLTSQENAGR